MSALRDERGCLTVAGLAAVRAAPPGQAPAELAGHLASCARCQDRLLAGGAAELAARKKTQPPPRWRLAAIVVALLLLVLSILVTAERLAGG
jgi:hypothetical protein